MVEQLALENALPAPKDLAHDVTVAVHDIERGFHQLAPADLAALAVYAEQPNLLPAVETLVDDIASVAPHAHVPTHSLDLLFA